MKYIKKYFNQNENQINPEFEKMPQDKLVNLTYSLKEKNNKNKEEIDKLTEENNNLKDTILNRKKNTSEIKSIYKDLKNTLFYSSEEPDIHSKNKEFIDFLYDQYLLYGGLEEEEINDLNQIKIKEDNWLDNRDLFIFKQKIIERNYQELFRNIAASNELIKLYGLNNIVNDNNSNIVKDNNYNEDNKKENLGLHSDKNVIGEGKKKNIKHKKDKEKDKLKEKKSSSDIKSKINIDSIDPIKNMKKKEEKNNLLDDLLKEDNNEEDNEISFKDISKNN